MLNKLNTRYILRLFCLAFLLLMSLIILSRTLTFETLNSKLEHRTAYYMQDDYKADSIKFVYASSDYMNSEDFSQEDFNKSLTLLLNNNLNRANTVVFDFILAESGNSEVDQALADAINNTNGAILSYEDKAFGSVDEYPAQMFYNNATYTGYRNFQYNDQGLAESYYPIIASNSNAVSLLVSTAQANDIKLSTNIKHMISVNSANSSEIVKLEDDYSFKRIPINFSNSNRYYAKNLLSGSIKPYELENSVVFIGLENDIVPTTYGDVTHAEYTANGVLSLITNNTYTYASLLLTFLVGLIMLGILVLTERSPKFIVRVIIIVATIISVLFLNFLSMKYLHLYFNLSVPILYTIVIFLFSSFSSFFVVREELIRDTDVVNEIKVLNNIKISESTFTNYIISIAPSILQKSGVEIVRPEIFQDSPLLAKIFSNADLNKTDVVFKRGYILIPLSKYKKDSTQNRYCLLKSKLLASDASVKNIIAFILSIDFHFKHIIETERENKLLYSIIEGIILSLNARDALTGEHSRRVAEFSVKIGTWLGYSEERLEKLHFVSLIHDIGKIGISDAILAKPSFYSDKDFAIMKTHPELGAKIMGNFLEDDDIKAAILQHHERPDGKGYPYGLVGDEILPIARIIKIADVYDALISSRHYKDAWSIDKVCDVLYQGRGTEFDTELIDIVLENVKPENWNPPVNAFEKPMINFDDDLKAISVEVYKNAMYTARTLKIQHSTNINIDFTNINNFLGVELGDNITSSDFIYKNPTLIYSDEDRETTYYAKTNNGNYSKAILVFLRNYYTGGCLISGLENKAAFSNEIKTSLGEHLYNDKSLTAWSSSNGQMFYVLFESQSTELENALIYFNKYLVFAD